MRFLIKYENFTLRFDINNERKFYDLVKSESSIKHRAFINLINAVKRYLFVRMRGFVTIVEAKVSVKRKLFRHLHSKSH